MSYRIKYDQIAVISNKKSRGFAFEALINEIYDDCKVLINKSYKTADGTQQIDGAIEINSKIFLIEAKWEKKETLAASKLYSFLGKINSKMEGTLGVFVSHEKLSDNFTKSIRNGLRQNCIIIHGKEDIENIIDCKLNLAEYTWYCFQKASTGSKKVDTAQFMSIPKQPSQTSTLTQTPPPNNNWFTIYNSLIGTDTIHQFSSSLISLYSKNLNLSNKLINLFPTLPYSILIDEKLKIFTNKLIEEEKIELIREIENKLKSDNWRVYVEKGFLHYIDKAKFDFKDKKAVIENVTKKFGSDFNLENDATEVINLLYDKTTIEEKQNLALIYLDIYCDRLRAERFPQKQFATKLFNYLKANDINIIEMSMSKIKEALLTYKNFENIFHTDTLEEYDLKEETVDRVLKRYHLVFQGHLSVAKKILEEEYDKL